jgi:streptogramin lyase
MGVASLKVATGVLLLLVIAATSCGADSGSDSAVDPTPTESAATPSPTPTSSATPEPTESATAEPTPTSEASVEAVEPVLVAATGELALDADFVVDMTIGPGGSVWAIVNNEGEAPALLNSAFGEWTEIAAPESLHLADARIAGLTPTGELWLTNGTQSNLAIWELRGETWTDRTPPATEQWGWAAPPPVAIGSDGTVWVITPEDGGDSATLRRFDGSTWTSTPIPPTFRTSKLPDWYLLGGPDHITGTSSGEFWGDRATRGALDVFDGNEWIPTERDEITPKSADETVIRLAAGDDGSVWALVTVADWINGDLTCCTEAWWQRFHEGNWTAIPTDPTGVSIDRECIAEQYGLIEDPQFDDPTWLLAALDAVVLDLDVAPDGSLWYVIQCVGIVRVDPEGMDGGLIGAEPGLPSLALNSIAVADDGTVWVGGNGGITVLQPES